MGSGHFPVSRPTTMGKKCDICGDIGVRQAILTCRQCKTNCEHMYCMTPVLEDPPPDGWICEDCEPKSVPQPRKRKISFDLSVNQVHGGASSGQRSMSDMRKKRVHWENKPKKPGKTVYITASEAIKLTTANTTPSPLPRLLSPLRSNVGSFRSTSTPAKPKIVPISSIYKKRLSSLPLQASPPRQQSKKPTEVKRPTIHVQSAQVPLYKNVCLPNKNPSEPKSPQIKAGIICEKRPWLNSQPGVQEPRRDLLSAQAPSNEYANVQKLKPLEVNLPRTQTESVTKKCSSAVAPRSYVPPLTISGVQEPKRDLLSAQAPSNEYANVQKLKPLEVNLPRKQTESVTEKRSSAVAPRSYVPPLTISESRSSSKGINGGTHVGQSLERGIDEVQSCTDGNSDAKLLPDSEKYSYAPARLVWKGIFNIQGSLEQGNLRHEIEAHISSRTNQKVHQISARLPELLDVEVVPCYNILQKLFPHFPDRRDIGLYLFPSQHQGSDDYSSLLNYMHANNYALRMQIGDVELLVFSSTLLPMDSQFWELKNFLWGVFHRVKGITKTPQEDVSQVTDMEIDMIGGVPVGRTDIVVQGEPSGKISRMSR